MGREEREEMCLFKDKWPKGKLTEEYIQATQGIETLHQIVEYMRQFELRKDKGDHWQSPAETYERKMGDCEDMAIMTLDILTRVLKVEEAYFIIYAGYYMKGGKRTYSAHAVCIFYHKNPMIYQQGYYEFTNKTLRSAFNKDQGNLIEYGYRHYPEGLKSYECRDHTGKIIKRKWKLIGYL